MPRRARPRRYEQHECVQCKSLFDAVRDDAKTCSAKCRVAFSRDRKAVQKREAARTATIVIAVRCAKCKATYDVMKCIKCPSCGTLEIEQPSASSRSA